MTLEHKTTAQNNPATKPVGTQKPQTVQIDLDALPEALRKDPSKLTKILKTFQEGKDKGKKRDKAKRKATRQLIEKYQAEYDKLYNAAIGK
jgi:hypothetical protein